MIHKLPAMEEGQLVVGDDVPFSFRLDLDPTGLPLYLMLCDGKHSLLELRLNRHSGLVIGVTLTLFGYPISNSVPEAFTGAPRENGWIRYDISGWETGRRDERIHFELARCDNSFFVVLDTAREPQTCIVGDRVGFFAAADHLCGIGFLNLTTRELEKFDELWVRSRVR